MSLSMTEKLQLQSVQSVSGLIKFCERMGWYGAVSFNPEARYENQRYRGQLGGAILTRKDKQELIDALVKKALEVHS